MIDGMMRRLTKHAERCVKCQARSVFEIDRRRMIWGTLVFERKLVERGYCDKALRMRDRLWSAVGSHRKQRVTK